MFIDRHCRNKLLDGIECQVAILVELQLIQVYTAGVVLCKRYDIHILRTGDIEVVSRVLVNHVRIHEANQNRVFEFLDDLRTNSMRRIAFKF